jgi:hypothetical protein
MQSISYLVGFYEVRRKDRKLEMELERIRDSRGEGGLIRRWRRERLQDSRIVARRREG